MSNDETMQKLKEIEAKRVAQQDKKKKPLTETALDCIYDPELKRYVKVTIKYNPETKEAKVESLTPLSDARYRAVYDLQNALISKLDKSLK